jgi:hypothetical protein
MILSATRGFYGSVSDKSIVKFDGAMVSLRKGLYGKYCYELYDKNGVLYKTYGAYALCDNGYHHWPTMMNPSKDAQDEDDYNWSEMLESLQKDVECLFGQMKQEFAILKYGCRFNSLELVDDIFLTCCAIHNQRKVIVGLDQVWSTDEILQDEESDLSQSDPAVFRRMSERSNRTEKSSMGPGDHQVLQEDVPCEHENSYDKVRQQLITHFKIMHKNDKLIWPTIKGVQKRYITATERYQT